MKTISGGGVWRRDVLCPSKCGSLDCHVQELPQEMNSSRELKGRVCLELFLGFVVSEKNSLTDLTAN